MSALKLGRRPHQPDSRDIKLSEILRGVQLPTPASHFGWGLDFGYGGWKMLGNGPDDTVFPGFQGAGDCYWAGQTHSIMEAAHNAKRQVPPFSGKTVIDQYAAYSGFNPQTGANDNGTDVREGLKWHQSKGILDDAGNPYKIGTYILLDHENPQELLTALWLFECVGWGMNFPGYAMQQFDRGEQWTWQTPAEFDGGHWIVLLGRPGEGLWSGVTWGRRQAMTEQFLLNCGEEAWCWLDPERYSAITGKSYQGWRDADLEAYITAMAQTPGR